jgi:hypothetical protein
LLHPQRCAEISVPECRVAGLYICRGGIAAAARVPIKQCVFVDLVFIMQWVLQCECIFFHLSHIFVLFGSEA